MARILYIGNKLGGAGNTLSSIETLGMFLQQEGHSVSMASAKKNKVLRILDMLRSTFRLRNQIDVVLIDTYSTQNFYFAVAIGRLCKKLKLPYIPILRGGNLPSRIARSKKRADALFNNAYVNVAPSHYLLHAFATAGYKNCTYIPNTILLEKYPFKERHKVTPQLLWVRSFARLYNPIMALELLKLLREKHYDAHLTMVGPEKDGSLEECKAYAASHNLPVTFTGLLTKEEWTQKAALHDIFINTTNFDNTPVSVMEAMALGMPVVSTNVGGIPYLIEDNVDGLLVPPENVEAMAEAVISILKISEKSNTLSVNARKKAETFDWEVVKRQWNELLSKCTL